MKQFCLVFALLASVAFRVYADSPLTSTNFSEAYLSNPMVAGLTKTKSVTDAVWAYIASKDTPIADKMAVINKIGWSIDGKSSAKEFLTYLKKKGICKSETDLEKKKDGALLLCMAYLMAMDDYFNVTKAAEMARKAKKLNSKSYTFNIVCAIIEAQEEMNNDGDWCKMWKLTEVVRKNEKSLTDDMKAEAKKVIFDYMDLYKSSCK